MTKIRIQVMYSTATNSFQWMPPDSSGFTRLSTGDVIVVAGEKTTYQFVRPSTSEAFRYEIAKATPSSGLMPAVGESAAGPTVELDPGSLLGSVTSIDFVYDGPAATSAVKYNGHFRVSKDGRPPGRRRPGDPREPLPHPLLADDVWDSEHASAIVDEPGIDAEGLVAAAVLDETEPCRTAVVDRVDATGDDRIDS